MKLVLSTSSKVNSKGKKNSAGPNYIFATMTAHYKEIPNTTSLFVGLAANKKKCWCYRCWWACFVSNKHI